MPMRPVKPPALVSQISPNLAFTTSETRAPSVGMTSPAPVHGKSVFALDVSSTPSPKLLHRSLASSSARVDYATGALALRIPFRRRSLRPLGVAQPKQLGPPLRAGVAESSFQVTRLQNEVATLRAALAAEQERSTRLEARVKELEEGGVVRNPAAPSAAAATPQAPADAHEGGRPSFRKRRLSRENAPLMTVGEEEEPKILKAASVLEQAAAAVEGARPPPIALLDSEEASEPASQPATGDEAEQEPSDDAKPSDAAMPSDAATPSDQAEVTWSISTEMGEENNASKIRALQPYVGSFSCHGAEPGGADGESTSKINQDCAGVAYPLAGRLDSLLVCVYDGHGEHGHVVSLEALNATHAALESAGDELLESPPAALASAFDGVNRLLIDAAAQPCVEIDARDSGACALAAYFRGADLWVANCGDCRAVLGTMREGVLSAVALSSDHKPDMPAESARIRECGGFVRPARGEGDDFSPARLYEDPAKPWLGPGLAISRSLGDLNANKCGLIPTPEVISHAVDPEYDLYLILASDGVWEFLSPTQAIDIVHKCCNDQGMSPTDACRYLIGSAALEWRQHEGDYRDDITATVLWLPDITRALVAA